MSPHDKCAFCGGELTTVGCVNFACSSKITAQLLWVNPNHHADVREEVAQLRASLATVSAELEQARLDLQEEIDAVTAERDAFDLERREKGDALLFHIKAYDLERAAHDETRRALEEQTKHRANLDRKNGQLNQDLWERIEYVATQQKDLESTRKALEVAEQALIAECENACSLGAAIARLEARVKAAMEYANGRWSEWGDRAERVRDILEGNGNV